MRTEGWSALTIEVKYHGGAYPGLTAHSGVICSVGHYNVRECPAGGLGGAEQPAGDQGLPCAQVRRK